MTQTHKIEEFVKRYCDKSEWNPNLNKNQHRERLRRTLNESEMMRFGVERLVDDAVSAKEQSFYSPIEQAVRDMLGMDEAGAEPAHGNHNNVTEVVDMEIDDQEEEDGERGEQDMELSDVEDAGAIEPHGIESRIEAFVRSFREAPPQLQFKPDPDAGLPQLSCIPVPLTTAASSQSSGSPSELEAPMYSPIRPDDEAFIKIEPLDPVPELRMKTSPVAHIKQEQLSPKEPAPLPPKLIKQEVTAEKKPATGRKRSPGDPSLSRRIPQETASGSPPDLVADDHIKLEEILSDVSSVHTSDLSDYDDRISISSGEEEADEKRKISLQEVRKLEDQVKKAERSNSNKSKKSKKTADMKTTRRERKVNPKYTSDEYSSIFGKKSGSLLEGEEEIDSEEDFDQDQKLNQAAVVVKEEKSSDSPPDDSSSFIDFHPKAPKNMEQGASEGTGSPSVSKPVKKKVPRKLSERYDTSDLYKPRPAIGSSRRNRSQAGDET